MLYLTGLALVAGVVIGLVRGGRFTHLARRRIRGAGLIAVGFGLQFATDHFAVHALGTALVLVGAAALLAFAAVNPNLVGIGVVAVGVAANALVIGVDNGMPVRPAAVVAAHIVTRAEEPVIGYGYRHHREGPGDQLRLLGDIIPVPPFREVVSFGDLILALGVAATLAGLLQPGPRHAAGPTGPRHAVGATGTATRDRTLEPTWSQDDNLAPKFQLAGPRPTPTLEPTWSQDDNLAPKFQRAGPGPTPTLEPTWSQDDNLAPKFPVERADRAAEPQDDRADRAAEPQDDRPDRTAEPPDDRP